MFLSEKMFKIFVKDADIFFSAVVIHKLNAKILRDCCSDYVTMLFSQHQFYFRFRIHECCQVFLARGNLCHRVRELKTSMPTRGKGVTKILFSKKKFENTCNLFETIDFFDHPTPIFLGNVLPTQNFNPCLCMAEDQIFQICFFFFVFEI